MIVALIPGYNEGPRIGEVVRAAAAHLPVLVVDDGSRDDTAAQARAAGASVIEQKPNQGKGAALRAGFRRALADGAEAVLTLDADGQHDPAEIPTFLSAWAAEPRPDLVIGRRNFRAMPPIRRLSNVLGGWAISWAVGRPIPDNQSGYRLVSRRIMEATPGKRRARLRVRGRDDHARASGSAARSPGSRSARSTPASRPISARSPT